ncbi:DUF1064 domain-containing protein [Labrys sp. La1]|uniref:DUF1064 domain-containing protein n=1 Tax=Labrys sp. La1 TaxID=3404917 RepID=UPI003EBB42D7
MSAPKRTRSSNYISRPLGWNEPPPAGARVYVREEPMTVSPQTISLAEYRALIASKPKPSKYRNVRVVVDGYRFDSGAEADRYDFLKLRQMAGQISDLELQPRFKLEVNGEMIATYIADFSYRENGREVVEDVKSPATRGIAGFRLKAKLFAAIHGFPITIVGKGIRA